MKISLTPQAESFVRQRQTTVGQTADDVINEALTLLEQVSKLHIRERERLNNEIRNSASVPVSITCITDLESTEMVLDPRGHA